MGQITRRNFVRQSVAGLGAVGAMGSVARAASALPTLAGVSGAILGANEKIRVGLIGSGGISRADLSAFLTFPDVDCPIVCDVDDAMIAKGVEQVEKARGKKPDGVRDFRRVIDRKDVDAVLVATPDHWHALPTIYACQAGKDVYCEKPLATTIREGRVMLDTARKHDRVVQMGTQWRSLDHAQEAIDVVHSGKLGRIRLVRCWAYLNWVHPIGRPADSDPPAGVDYDLWLGPAPKRPFNRNRFHFNFRWFWDYAGGLMTDWGVHLINVAMWGMKGRNPSKACCTGGKYAMDDMSETPDTQIATYEFGDCSLIWEHQYHGAHGPEGREHGVMFNGSEATLVLDSHGWEITPEPDKKVPAEKHKPSGRDARVSHVKDFLDCMRSRKRPVEDFEIGHCVSTVAALGNLALRTGRTITWDAAKEQAVGDEEANRLVTREYRAPWRLE